MASTLPPPPLVPANFQQREIQMAYFSGDLQRWWKGVLAQYGNDQSALTTAVNELKKALSGAHLTLQQLNLTLSFLASITPNQIAALQGTYGVPGINNRYVTATDPALQTARKQFNTTSNPSWTHGLGFPPIVQVTDLNGNLVDCNPQVDFNTITVQFTASFSGYFVIMPGAAA